MIMPRVVTVTSEDIRAGKPAFDRCPVALAAQRAFSADSAWVGGKWCIIIPGPIDPERRYCYRLPAEIQQWVGRYDLVFTRGRPLPGEIEFKLTDSDLARFELVP